MSTDAHNKPPSRVPTMRGRTLHNFVVNEAREVFDLFGFETAIECPVGLADGRRDFVDLLATRGRHTIACEIETTTRNVVTNVANAKALRLRLWVVTPNRRVLDAVTGKLRREGALAGVRVLMLGQLLQAVGESFPTFARANVSRSDRIAPTSPAPRRLARDMEPSQ